MTEAYKQRLIELGEELYKTVEKINVTGEEIPHELSTKIYSICGYINALKGEVL